MELTARQMAALEALFAAGFRPVAIPPYESALCVQRGEYAAVLAPLPGGGLRMMTPPSLLIEGHLSVKISKNGRDYFVWKAKEVSATPELLRAAEAFQRELLTILDRGTVQ